MPDLQRVDLAIHAKTGLRTDIRGPISIPMHDRATARVRATKHPPSWRGSTLMVAVATCPRRIVFGDLLDGNALAARLVAQVLHELPVRPLTDLLVRDRALFHAVGHVSDIAHRQAVHTLLHGKVHNLA